MNNSESSPLDKNAPAQERERSIFHYEIGNARVDLYATGGLKINVGGSVHVRTFASWHKLAEAERLGVSAERDSIIEECAKVCDERAGMEMVAWPRDPALLECAKAIRTLKGVAEPRADHDEDEGELADLERQVESGRQFRLRMCKSPNEPMNMALSANDLARIGFALRQLLRGVSHERSNEGETVYKPQPPQGRTVRGSFWPARVQALRRDGPNGAVLSCSIRTEDGETVNMVREEAPVKQHPVAWQYTKKENGEKTLTHQPPDRVMFPEDYEIVPLFAASAIPTTVPCALQSRACRADATTVTVWSNGEWACGCGASSIFPECRHVDTMSRHISPPPSAAGRT